MSSYILPAYIFLTLFTSLIPTLFYFSIWELGIAGQELALLAVLSPFSLGYSSVYSFAKSQKGQVVLQSLSLSGLLAYLFDNPLARLAVVAPAVALATLAATAKWSDGNESHQAISTSLLLEAGISLIFAVFGLGWVMTSLLKHGNHTNNPRTPTNIAKRSH